MSFDPGELTVKDATKALDGLSDEELEAVYDAELGGKGRVSLLNAVTSKRDGLREEGQGDAPSGRVPGIRRYRTRDGGRL